MVYRTLSSLMMSVINDWDLSSPENESGSHERTGMIPFMAMDLLTKKAIKGKAEQMYQCIAESFFWVHIWVYLQYEDGKLLSKDRPLDCWLTGDAHSCQTVKHGSLKLAMENRTGVSLPPKPFLELDLFLLTLVFSFYVEDHDFSILERGCMFRNWFMTQLPLSIWSLIHSSKCSLR
jgi:hypothetical protein